MQCVSRDNKEKDYLEEDSKYKILNLIPYNRIVTQDQEIYHLYELGLFKVDAVESLVSDLSSPTLRSDKIIENVQLVELLPNTEFKVHYHKKTIAVIYIVLGSGTFILGDNHLRYERGERFIIPATVPHGFIVQKSTLFLSIQSPSIRDEKSGKIDIYY